MKQSLQQQRRKYRNNRRRHHSSRAFSRPIKTPIKVTSNRVELSHLDPFEFAWGSRGGYIYAAIGRSCVELLALIWGKHRDIGGPVLSFAYNEHAKRARTEAYSDYPRGAITLIDCGDLTAQQALAHIYLDEVQGISYGTYILIEVSSESAAFIDQHYRGTALILCLTSRQIEVMSEVVPDNIVITERKLMLASALKPFVEGLSSLCSSDGFNYRELRHAYAGRVAYMGACFSLIESYQEITDGAMQIAGMEIGDDVATEVVMVSLGGHYTSCAETIAEHNGVRQQIESELSDDTIVMASSDFIDQDPGFKTMVVVIIPAR